MRQSFWSLRILSKDTFRSKNSIEIISFSPLNESTLLIIDIVSQNRLNTPRGIPCKSTPRGVPP